MWAAVTINTVLAFTQHQSSSSVSLSLFCLLAGTLLGLMPTLGTQTTPGWLSLSVAKLSCLPLLPAVTAVLPLSLLPVTARCPCRCLAGLGGAFLNVKVDGSIPGGQKFDCKARLGL